MLDIYAFQAVNLYKKNNLILRLLMDIIQLLQSKLSQGYQPKQWNISNSNQKDNTSLLWRQLHFCFIIAAASFHTLAAFIITPPIYGSMREIIPVSNVSSWLFAISSLNFVCAVGMQNILKLNSSCSGAQKSLQLLCLISAFLYLFSSLKLTSMFYNSENGDIIWIVAAVLLTAVKLATIAIMSQNDITNALIICQNEEFRYQARLFGVGIIETISGILFIYSSFYYNYYASAAICLLFASLLRIRVSFKLYLSYFPKISSQLEKNQFGLDMEHYYSPG